MYETEKTEKTAHVFLMMGKVSILRVSVTIAETGIAGVMKKRSRFRKAK